MPHQKHQLFLNKEAGRMKLMCLFLSPFNDLITAAGSWYLQQLHPEHETRKYKSVFYSFSKMTEKWDNYLQTDSLRITNNDLEYLFWCQVIEVCQNNIMNELAVLYTSRWQHWSDHWLITRHFILLVGPYFHADVFVCPGLWFLPPFLKTRANKTKLPVVPDTRAARCLLYVQLHLLWMFRGLFSPDHFRFCILA